MPLTCLEQDVSKDVYFYAENSTPPISIYFCLFKKNTTDVFLPTLALSRGQGTIA